MQIINGYEMGINALNRKNGEDVDNAILETVTDILAQVKVSGDAAIKRLTEKFDGKKLTNIEINQANWLKSLEILPPNLKESLQVAAKRIQDFHQLSMPKPWSSISGEYEEKIIPIETVGIYVPGGTANYPSAVLMDVIPAKVAGVPNVIVCTPDPTDAVLASAKIAGADRLFQVGGAQAIAAMAYGTESIPQVDKICGAGGTYVSAAKKMVYGDVGIDGIYGPTETLIVADSSATPSVLAADLLAQAEHDTLAIPILITDDVNLAKATIEEIYLQLPELERYEIAKESIANKALAVVLDDIGQAPDLINQFSPEHVCLILKNPENCIKGLKSAGGVFVGEYSPEVIGDYVAGPSHTMPTSGTARFSSYLGVDHFLRKMPVVRLGHEGFNKLATSAATIAREEGLTAHANAVELRLTRDSKNQGLDNE